MPGSPGLFHESADVIPNPETPPSATVTSDEASLLAKLSDVAEAEKTAAERRRRFQRSRDNWRRRTQPVTLGEISEADRYGKKKKKKKKSGFRCKSLP